MFDEIRPGANVVLKNDGKWYKFVSCIKSSIHPCRDLCYIENEKGEIIAVTREQITPIVPIY